MQNNKNILGYYNCIHCGKVFGTDEIENAITLKKSNQGRLTHLTCKRCQSSTILGLFDGKASGLIGLATDLTNQDLERKRKSKAITTDDVLKLNDLINQI